MFFFFSIFFLLTSPAQHHHTISNDAASLSWPPTLKWCIRNIKTSPNNVIGHHLGSWYVFFFFFFYLLRQLSPITNDATSLPWPPPLNDISGTLKRAQTMSNNIVWAHGMFSGYVIFDRHHFSTQDMHFLLRRQQGTTNKSKTLVFTCRH